MNIYRNEQVFRIMYKKGASSLSLDCRQKEKSPTPSPQQEEILRVVSPLKSGVEIKRWWYEFHKGISDVHLSVILVLDADNNLFTTYRQHTLVEGVNEKIDLLTRNVLTLTDVMKKVGSFFLTTDGRIFTLKYKAFKIKTCEVSIPGEIIVDIFAHWDHTFLITQSGNLYFIAPCTSYYLVTFWKHFGAIEGNNGGIYQTTFHDVVKTRFGNACFLGILRKGGKLTLLEEGHKMVEYENIIDIEDIGTLAALRDDGCIGIYDYHSCCFTWKEDWGTGFTFHPSD